MLRQEHAVACGGWATAAIARAQRIANGVAHRIVLAASAYNGGIGTLSTDRT